MLFTMLCKTQSICKSIGSWLSWDVDWVTLDAGADSLRGCDILTDLPVPLCSAVLTVEVSRYYEYELEYKYMKPIIQLRNL